MAGTNVTRDEAHERSLLLAVDSYDIDLDLTTSDTLFATSTTVRFSCRTPGASTFIDLIADSVETIELNGESLDPQVHYDGARVRLPSLQTDNELTVRAQGRYMNSGEGLHRFVDPVDQEVYLYTQFEVPDSRRVFAVFEQPDLKARFRFHVTAPAHWQVVSCSPTPEPVTLGRRRMSAGAEPQEVARWDFDPTPVLSSYITAVVAGPYHVVRDSVETGGRTVPLAVMCRRSLRPYLDADEIFDITKRGFAFFADQFGMPYPFAKYDQIFTPEYNMGAMENVGAVTFHEMYVFRSAVSAAHIEQRACTIMHELSHMWFGNLVTMQWWDDLWLNESFAEWAATDALVEATRWRDAWTTFAVRDKAWAYQADQLSTTHPVASDMRSLEDVETNFDGITYAKGASVLKQLVAYVGRDAFLAGLRRYFADHAWSNTTLTDLLEPLAAASGRDLQAWAHSWLETSGVETLHVDVEGDETITGASVRVLSPAQRRQVGPHRIGIGAYDLREGRLTRTERWEVDLTESTTALPFLTGRPRPDVLLLNDDDLAYAKIRLDDRSAQTVLDHPGALVESLPRALVAGMVWDMTRDAGLPARRYIDWACSLVRHERDSSILKATVAGIDQSLRWYVDRSRREETARVVVQRAVDLLDTPGTGRDAALLLMPLVCRWAADSDVIDRLEALVEGTATMPTVTVDTDMRWRLVTALARAGRWQQERIDAEVIRDDTATGREHAARARAAVPTAEAKAWAWETALDGNGVSNEMLRAVAEGFQAVHDVELLRPYVDPYHAALDRVWTSRSYAMAERVVGGFYPSEVADHSVVAATDAWLASRPDAPAGLRRIVTEQRDAVERTIAAQAADAADVVEATPLP